MFKNTKNLSDNARIVRMALGLLLLVAVVMGLSDPLRTIAIVLATYGLVTGALGYCPIVEAMGSPKKSRVTTKAHKKHKRR